VIARLIRGPVPIPVTESHNNLLFYNVVTILRLISALPWITNIRGFYRSLYDEEVKRYKKKIWGCSNCAVTKLTVRI
jgi:hypothetical protein